MSGSIYKAGSGAILQQMRLDVYSNNLANVNTVGFKADQPVFQIEEKEIPTGTHNNTAILNPYAHPIEYNTNFDSGPLQQTGGKLDAAIVGKGFFEVQSPEGLQYTRSGRFSINDQGELSTPEGWPIMGQGGSIAIDGNRIDIGDDGQVLVDGDVAGVLRVVDFDDRSQLRKTGSTLFTVDKPSAGLKDATDYRISQGSLESSNVDAIRTMTEIIESMRVFETYQKVIRAADDATAKTVNEVGRNA